MERKCREPIKRYGRRLTWVELLRNVKVVSDPKQLARLHAELEKRKRRGDV